MSDLTKSFSELNLLEELANRQTVIHQIHPLMKVLTTLAYVLVTVSFGKYELGNLLPLVFYPIVLMTLAELPPTPLLKRVLLVSPLIIGIGLFNPLFNREPFLILLGVKLSAGWVSFFTILVKGFLTVLAALILVATTGMNRIAVALKDLRMPGLLVTQILLTYRYITVLMEEVGRLLRAYSLRSPTEKGVRLGIWGSLTGQLLLRTLDRAQRIYQAMCCRGFTGEDFAGAGQKIKKGDVLYFAGWSAFFLVTRYVDLPLFLGSLIMGVGK